MSLKLVVPDNVAELPVGNLMDIAGMARRFAKNIDDGKWGEITSVVSVIVTPEGLRIFPWGEMPNGYELMGIFEAAKLEVFADQITDDD